MKRYEELSEAGQIARLGKAARKAWQAYDLGEAKIRLTVHGYNTTFRVEARNGRRYALRLNPNNLKPAEATLAEVEWTTALADAGVAVVRPVQGRVVQVPFHGRPEGLSAVMYPWLDGQAALGTKGAWIGAALARLNLALHAHSAEYRPQAAVREETGPLYGREMRLHGYAACEETVAKAEGVWRKLLSEPARLIHGDLHRGNVIVHRGRLTAFDFDDMCLGRPAQDAAVTLYDLRAAHPRLEEGYRKEMTPDRIGVESHELEALVAGRQAARANDVFHSKNREWRSFAPGYAAIAETRLAHYLRTGRFDPSVAAYPW